MRLAGFGEGAALPAAAVEGGHSAWAAASGLGRAWFMQPAQAKLLGRLSGIILIDKGLWLSLA